MRATNLQELVYKNGQAGITKATVSITFDNRDADQCPFGYSHYDEIVVTRQVSSRSCIYMYARRPMYPYKITLTNKIPLSREGYFIAST